MDNVVGFIVAMVIPVVLYGLSGIYLQRVVKTRFASILYVFCLGLGGLGAVLLIVSAVIPHGMPSLLAYLLLLIPVVLASGVFVLRLVKK